MSGATATAPGGGRTAWSRNLAAPVRSFLKTEAGGAAWMLGAAVAALVWANVSFSAYSSLWATQLTVQIGHAGISMDLQHWVNKGLMTMFFLVVGLEAKRELDMGELRERRRIVAPLLAAAGGLAIPIAIFVAATAGGGAAHGWGTAMSTDTAFALGSLALLAPRSATRVRVYLLTISVFDDLGALIVIATVYAGALNWTALAIAAILFGGLVALRWLPFDRRAPSIVLAVGLWIATYESGVDPVVTGLLIGLVTGAYPPSREDLERATHASLAFREQPTADLARSLQREVGSVISANERLQYALHPVVSYGVLPLFALANAGVLITGGVLSAAISSPVFLGIVLAYLVGKPVGTLAGAWLATRPGLHGARPLVSGPVQLVAGACAGVGFTVTLLIASLSFSGRTLAESKLAALTTVVLAPALGAAALALVRRLPERVRKRQIARTAEDLADLAYDVDLARDHIRGPDDAPVTLLEYGDFECVYCGQAETVVRELLAASGSDVRYVWRHLPLVDVHPFAQVAAETSEAAASQGRFWDMYDVLISHQGELTPADLERHARDLGLDIAAVRDELRRRVHAGRIRDDVAGADESGVSGTPTFFINGRRHYGVYDLPTLTAAVAAAKDRAQSRATAAG